MATHEHSVNYALGEVLRGLRPYSWYVHAEKTRTPVLYRLGFRHD